MTFTAGQKVRASQLNEQGVIVARARRTTNDAGSAAVRGILRLDDVPVLAGRAYRIFSSCGMFCLTADNARADMTLRFTTDGSTPTTSSPIMRLSGRQLFINGFVEPDIIEFIYVPSVDETLSLLLCHLSVIGGLVVFSYGAANWPVEITITDLGGDPGDTGVDI